MPIKSLFGFERVHVPAGKTVTVWIYPSATAFAHVDEDGTHRVTPGEYTVEFGVAEAADAGMGFLRHRFIAE